MAVTIVLLAAAASLSLLPDAHLSLNYLLKHRPPQDAAIAPQALKAHAAARCDAAAECCRRFAHEDEDIPYDVFCNAVLPYRALDEPLVTEDIAEFLPSLEARVRPLVADATTATEAVLMMNEKLFDALSVRFEANQSPAFLTPRAVIENGAASCSGLSILLVQALRAIGIPARCAGVSDWGGEHAGTGNHVWVEVWLEGKWRFIGAAEPTALDETWFAERLRGGSTATTVYAALFHRVGSRPDSLVHFPLPWQLQDGFMDEWLDSDVDVDAVGTLEKQTEDESDEDCVATSWVTAVDVSERYTR